MSDDETKILITFQIASGGLDNAGMVTYDRDTREIDFGSPPPELLQLEIENLERLLGDLGEDIGARDLAARLREVEDLLY